RPAASFPISRSGRTPTRPRLRSPNPRHHRAATTAATGTRRRKSPRLRSRLRRTTRTRTRIPTETRRARKKARRTAPMRVRRTPTVRIRRTVHLMTVAEATPATAVTDPGMVLMAAEATRATAEATPARAMVDPAMVPTAAPAITKALAAAREIPMALSQVGEPHSREYGG